MKKKIRKFLDEYQRFIDAYPDDGRFIRRFRFCWRGWRWFGLKNWYGFRWGQDGCFWKEKIWLIDIGGITIGWDDIDSSLKDKETV